MNQMVMVMFPLWMVWACLLMTSLSVTLQLYKFYFEWQIYEAAKRINKLEKDIKTKLNE